ncbi:helix-turn-helix domain-containing protein [Tumebacillus lipolyticus]|uniref:Helix-turn-helix domain-containing protein n=1 Tax=Tumebacillus lipolyticus TaxID=1280370 RepID=A0ABW5A2U3_9BACL
MLNERLKKMRKAKKLTQKQVAEKLEITESGYGFYEQGRNDPPKESLDILADLFDCSVDYLLGRSDIPHLSAAEAKKLRTIKDVRRDLEEDKILDVDGTPFSPEGKQLALMQIDALIKMREMGK